MTRVRPHRPTIPLTRWLDTFYLLAVVDQVGTAVGAAAVGTPVPRLEGADKVSGRVCYAYDTMPAGTVHGALVLAPAGPGTVTAIDMSHARLPGVLLVSTHEECRPVLQRLTWIPDQTNGRRPHENLVPLQDAEIHYPGQIVAMIVAETPDVARQAADAVRVTIERKPGVNVAEPGSVLDWTAAMPDAVHVPQVKGVPTDEAIGDRTRCDGAAERLERVYTTPMHFHSAMERHGRVAWWEGDTLFVQEPTQWVRGTARALAQVLGIEDRSVNVINPFVGGAFGGKAYFRYDCALAAWAARELRRPVCLELTREQTFALVGSRPATRQRVVLTADTDGHLAGVSHESWTSGSRVDPGYQETCGYQTRVLYSTPWLRTTHRIVPFDLPTTCPMRGPGASPGSFAIETAMNELADQLGLDPLDLRLRNFAEVEPVTGRPFSAKHLRGCYAVGAEGIGWSRRNARPGSLRDGEWLVGYGMATASYDVVQYEHDAEVELLADGSAEVRTAAHDLGTGTYTVLTQVAAQALGLPLGRVRCRLGDSRLPPASVAAGQAQANSAASAVLLAAQDAVARRERGDPAPLTGRSRFSPRSSIGDYSPQSWGAQFAEVAVSSVTGEVRVRRLVGSFDVGRVLNARTARSQLMGGMVFGIGMALGEAGEIDRSGFQANASLGEYLVPVHADVPRIDVVMLDRPDMVASPIMGAKGCGEIGTVGVAAAITSAVQNATGCWVRDLPLQLDKLLPALAT